MKKLFPLIFFSILTVIFFKPFFFKFELPIPSDTIVGLYHPFRDVYEKEYPRGIPFKNFLITDPVRQQYPWKKLILSLEKNLELPLWNPYNFGGYPLLANFQSASFYPLNFLFFLITFDKAWALLIIAQIFLALIFMFIYLRSLKINCLSSVLGSIVFAFSGFSISWLEWGTVLNTALWLPLILLSTDKILENLSLKTKNKRLMLWSPIFLFSLMSSFFAGHLQIFFYIFIFSTLYLLTRWFQNSKKIKLLLPFAVFYLLFVVVTAIQWFPTMQFILQSARDTDQILWQKEGWFIPWQNLIQFVSPDFFGNPATLNYWGIWNYAEFVGYIGVLPFIFSIYGLFFRRDKKTFFFGTLFFLSLIFSLPTFFAKIPYILRIPFISTSQPTRLMFLSDFSLSVLCALGFDYFLRLKKRNVFYIILGIFLVFISLWVFVYLGKTLKVNLEDLSVAKRNLLFPSLLFFTSSLLIFLIILFKKQKAITLMLYVIIIGLTIFDLFRFGFKFTPFTKQEYLFPNTQVTNFLKSTNDNFRVMSKDPRILAPNFSTNYHIQTLDGYDPLFLKRYGELIAASERGQPDISSPFGFNRIINPQRFESKIVDLMGVKYVLSLEKIKNPDFIEVFKEGQTLVYENKNAFPRAFFINNLKVVKDKDEAINFIFSNDIDLRKDGVVENYNGRASKFSDGKVSIVKYSESKVLLKTENKGEGFLVLTDSFYPSWHVRIDGKETKIYRTDYNFRGVIVPDGDHEVEFYITLF